jgi:hypothetical protein
MLCSYNAFSRFALTSIRESSAKRRCDILGALGQTFTPAIRPALSALFSKALKPETDTGREDPLDEALSLERKSLTDFH